MYWKSFFLNFWLLCKKFCFGFLNHTVPRGETSAAFSNLCDHETERHNYRTERHHNDTITNQNATITDLNATITDRNTTLTDRNATITDWNATITDWNATITPPLPTRTPQLQTGTPQLPTGTPQLPTRTPTLFVYEMNARVLKNRKNKNKKFGCLSGIIYHKGFAFRETYRAWRQERPFLIAQSWHRKIII